MPCLKVQKHIYIPHSASAMTPSLQFQRTHSISSIHPKIHRTLVFASRVHSRTTPFQPPPATTPPSLSLPDSDPS
ncbi:hypothetical protein PSPO01_07992 [Paraphaeosphaeria sporulosa]